MFGLSYNTMPHHLAVLHHAWNLLRPGGRLVIMDAKLPPGLGGRLVLPFSLWLMKRTMLGNPLIQPWEDLARLADAFEMEQFMFGSWYICRGDQELGVIRHPIVEDARSALVCRHDGRRTDIRSTERAGVSHERARAMLGHQQ